MIIISTRTTPDEQLCSIAYAIEELAERHADAPGMTAEADRLKALALGLIKAAERLDDARDGGPTTLRAAPQTGAICTGIGAT